MKKFTTFFCLLIFLFTISNFSWGQYQSIGSFPLTEGGFDGTAPDASLPTTLSTIAWTRQSQSTTNGSIIALGGRSSSAYATVSSTSTSSSRVLQSPQTLAITASTAYRIQFYYRSSGIATNFQSGFTVNGTAAGNYTTSASLPSSSGIWIKYEATKSSDVTSVTSNGSGIIRFSNTGGGWLLI